MTEPSYDGADDGFHEIQLSGKQLVFLFMAATVISVMVFLCGVLVGRGVKGDTVSAAENVAAPPPAASPGETRPVADATANPATPPDNPSELSYPGALRDDKPANNFKPTERPAAESTADKVETAPAATAAAAPKPTPTPTPRATPASSGKPLPGEWAVQVVALSDRAAANAVVQRLQAKSYPAFVVEPRPNEPVQTYKVQVGKFVDRSEAEQVRSRLKKEEQFEPIIRR